MILRSQLFLNFLLHDIIFPKNLRHFDEPIHAFARISNGIELYIFSLDYAVHCGNGDKASCIN